MKLGIIGLGRMGSNMSVRILEAGHEVVDFADRLLSAMRFEFGGHEEKRS